MISEKKMKTLRERNQERQYELAHFGLDKYNAMLRAVDISGKRAIKAEILKLQTELAGVREPLNILKKQGLDKNTLGGLEEVVNKKEQQIKEMQKAVKSRSYGPNPQEIEVIINTPNGSTDVILPVKFSDLSTADKILKYGESLFDKLYDSVYTVLAHKDFVDVIMDEKEFEEYIAISMHGRLAPSELKCRIMANAPVELQAKPHGSRNSRASGLLLRVAENFCFKYDEIPTVLVNDTVNQNKPKPSTGSSGKKNDKSGGGYAGVKVPGSQLKEITDITTMRHEMVRMQVKYDGKVTGSKVRETYSRIELKGQPVSDGGLRAHIANANRAYVQSKADPIKPRGVQYSITDRASLHSILDSLQETYKGEVTGTVVRQHCSILELNGTPISVGSLASHLAQSKSRYKSRSTK